MNNIKKIIQIILQIFILILFLFSLSFTIFLFYFNYNYKDRVLPNIYFNDSLVSRKKYNEVLETVITKKENLPKAIKLKYEDKEIVANSSDELGFFWDENKTAKEIMASGRDGNYLNNFIFFIQSLFSRKEIKMDYTFDSSKAGGYLEKLATEIDKKPVDGKFEIQNKKVTSFAIGSNGKKLDIGKSVQNILSSLISRDDLAYLVVSEEKAIGADKIDEMGVKEIIATGESSFAGSPTNRVHNIKIGADVFNGILIAPQENFSFITYLGEVSAKTGYLPELVIKEDKTIPEYGGGLCQVSTTFFRAAINAGFPIIERTAHTYRVFYYEPAGFDSTIYQPKPDLIFKNDTDHYILVQTRISGTNLFVDFYGTPDGRKVEVSKSTVYNYVQPGDPIMIETTGLKPGEKKQTDTAHVGADAYFTRKITYADGKVKDDRFDSHYIPWRAKFLVGKEETKTPEVIPLADIPTTPNNPDNNSAPTTP